MLLTSIEALQVSQYRHIIILFISAIKSVLII